MPVENRVYPVRDPQTVERMQAAFNAKLSANLERGERELSTGAYNPFVGVPESFLRSTFYAMAELDEASRNTITERVTGPMEELAQTYGVPSFFASKGDLPPHLSFQVGNYHDMTEEEIEASREFLNSSYSHIQPLKDILCGVSMDLDTLVVAANSTICASVFNASQGAPYRAKKVIEEAMTRATRQPAARVLGIKGDVAKLRPPYRYGDISYVSVGRITEKVDPVNLMAYKRAAEHQIGERLKSEPIRVTTSLVFIGTAVDVYNKHAPQLILRGQ